MRVEWNPCPGHVDGTGWHMRGSEGQERQSGSKAINETVVFVPTSHPFHERKCKSGDCLVCTEGDGGKCRVDVITYKAWAVEKCT